MIMQNFWTITITPEHTQIGEIKTDILFNKIKRDLQTRSILHMKKKCIYIHTHIDKFKKKLRDVNSNLRHPFLNFSHHIPLNAELLSPSSNK